VNKELRWSEQIRVIPRGRKINSPPVISFFLQRLPLFFQHSAASRKEHRFTSRVPAKSCTPTPGQNSRSGLSERNIVKQLVVIVPHRRHLRFHTIQESRLKKVRLARRPHTYLRIQQKSTSQLSSSQALPGVFTLSSLIIQCFADWFNTQFQL
jgi:hypothetical protein